jgi:hypothetical protein
LPPTAGPTAQVRIEGTQFVGASSMRAVYYRNGKCDEYAVLGNISALTSTKSDAGTSIPKKVTPEEGAYFDRIIEANQETNITIRGYTSYSRCFTQFSFLAEPGKMYRIHLLLQGGMCFAQGEQITLIDNQIQLNQITLRPQKNSCATGF